MGTDIGCRLYARREKVTVKMAYPSSNVWAWETQSYLWSYPHAPTGERVQHQTHPNKRNLPLVAARTDLWTLGGRKPPKEAATLAQPVLTNNVFEESLSIINRITLAETIWNTSRLWIFFIAKHVRELALPIWRTQWVRPWRPLTCSNVFADLICLKK